MFGKTHNASSSAMTLATVLLVAAGAIGCSGGGSAETVVTPSTLTASFVESGTGEAPNQVRTTGSSAAEIVGVQVVIGGPTSSSDLYSFAFDVVLGDATVAEYVAGSAAPGNALTAGGGQSLQVLAVQQGNRVTVGVTKLGGGAGNGVAGPEEAVVVDLAFRLLRPGTTTLTIEGSPGSDPAALDSGGSEIPGIAFDAGPASLTAI